MQEENKKKVQGSGVTSQQPIEKKSKALDIANAVAKLVEEHYAKQSKIHEAEEELEENEEAEEESLASKVEKKTKKKIKRPEEEMDSEEE